jgi:hypothetical protein
MTTAYDPRHLRSVDYQRLYPSVSPGAAPLAVKWDLAITYGTDGEEWVLEVNGQETSITAQVGDTANDVAGDLRTAAALLTGVTVTGATNHVILELAAPNGPEDPIPEVPVLTPDDTGTSTTTVVSAASVSGFGVTTVDQK